MHRVLKITKIKDKPTVTYKVNGTVTTKTLTEWYFGKDFVKKATEQALRGDKSDFWQNGTGKLTVVINDSTSVSDGSFWYFRPAGSNKEMLVEERVVKKYLTEKEIKDAEQFALNGKTCEGYVMTFNTTAGEFTYK